jgi:aromatic-L-amino-acid decarboxylase
MDKSDYTKWSNRATDWGQKYLNTVADRPVRAQVKPGDIAAKLDPIVPEDPQDMERIFSDFEEIVPDGMTHWQHPRFFAYFPTNATTPAMVAEQLVTIMTPQCMLWQTSPAATEMEQVVISWLQQGLGLPDHFKGVLQDTATTATFSAILTMRERTLGWEGLTKGMAGGPTLRIYASAQTHSSIDKSVRLSGIGQDNLVKVPTDENFSMQPDTLKAAIDADVAAGLTPAGVVLCVGGTSIGASDNIADCIKVAKDAGLYVHVDAAWAGSAMLCPEYRHLWAGVEGADSIVFNPYKWLGAVSDCSVQFLADPTPQVKTLGLRPAYLETLGEDEITNFNEWSISLGRRFRSLKLWFLIRAYGLTGLRTRIRNHVNWVAELCEVFRSDSQFEITTEPRLALFSFQYAPADRDADEATQALLTAINDDGRIYLTQTIHEGRFVIRMTAGHFDCTREDVMMVYDVAKELAKTL